MTGILKTKWVAWLFALMLVPCTGCVTSPLDSTKSSAHSSSHRKRGGGGGTGGQGASRGRRAIEDTRSERLVINGEVLESTGMWQELHAELTDRANVMAPDQFGAFVEERFGRWVADATSEVLLFDKASGQISSEISERIDGYVEGEIRKIIARDHDGVRRRYEKHLASQGTSLNETHERVRREVIISSFLESEVRPKVQEPTRAELMEAYELYRDDWSRPSRRRMSLIDIRLAGRLPEDVREPTEEQRLAAHAQARSDAQAALLDIRNGASFSDVARASSDGLHAVDGGAWGWVGKDSVRERFEPAVEVLYRLEAEAVSELVETDGAFFIVRCDEIDPGSQPSFEDVQPRLRERYTQASYNRLISELVDKLRREARVEPADVGPFRVAAIRHVLEEVSKSQVSGGGAGLGWR